MKRFCLCVICLVLTVLTEAGALQPEQVAIVANAKSEPSVALAQLYAELRGIPEQNIVTLKTSTNVNIARVGYERQILTPLKRILTERGLASKIRCLVILYGVPVRVMGPKPPKPTDQQQLYRREATRAHYRLASDYQLLATVAREFPTHQTTKLKPLGKLFAAPLPKVIEPLKPFEPLRRDLEILLQQKRQRVANIEDPAKRQIADRQLGALVLDIYGLEGLIDHLRSARSAGYPDIQHIQRVLEAAQKQLEQSQQDPPDTAEKVEILENIKAQLVLLDALGGACKLYDHAVAKGGMPPQDEKPKNFEEKTRIAADASVDSELALMWWPEYPLKGWVNNSLYWRIAPQLQDQSPPLTLMTARIDASSVEDAMRMIKEASAVEKTGLRGHFYLDAGGGPPLSPAMVSQYDKHFSFLHNLLRQKTNIQSILDTQRPVFQPGTCPNAALYVGWYSLRKYVPAFGWKTGAVGWHVASWEAQHLRDPESQEWCVQMLQNGVAATIGAVGEPFLVSFPIPEEFFALLLTGKYTLAECYWRTCPMASWRMMLLGDPLYNPFAVNPQLSVEDLPEGLAP